MGCKKKLGRKELPRYNDLLDKHAKDTLTTAERKELNGLWAKLGLLRTKRA